MSAAQPLTTANARSSTFAIVEKCVKLAFFLAAPLLGHGFGRELYMLGSSLSLTSHRFRAFSTGVLVFTVLWYTLVRRLKFFATFEHELTHLLFGLLFLKRPRSLQAYDGNGMVTMHGHNFVIGLAPYTFPTFSYLLIALGWFFARSQWLSLHAMLGVTTAFHGLTTLDETRCHQPDLRREGLVFSWIFVVVVNLMTYGAVIAFVAHGPSGFAAYWKSGFASIWRTVASWL